MSASRTDSLLVYLSESQIPFHVNLRFENNYSDTVFVTGIYKNFYLEWESRTGVMVETYEDNKCFKLGNLGEMDDVQYFRFTDSNFLIIPTHSTLEFSVFVRRYFPSSKMDKSIGVRFHINYLYGILNDAGDSEFVRTKTNYVEVKKDEK